MKLCLVLVLVLVRHRDDLAWMVLLSRGLSNSTVINRLVVLYQAHFYGGVCNMGVLSVLRIMLAHVNVTYVLRNLRAAVPTEVNSWLE